MTHMVSALSTVLPHHCEESGYISSASVCESSHIEYNTMACPHQILTAAYPLNKSATKQMLVGLEYDHYTDDVYKPVIRLTSKDFRGIAFSTDSWIQLKETFPDIYKYFHEDTDFEDRRIYGDGWVVRFTHSHKERAVEIEERVRKVPSSSSSKCFKYSMTMKKVTFDWLHEYVYRAIDYRLRYLKSIARNVSCVAAELITFIKNEASAGHDAQIQEYTASMITDVEINLKNIDVEYIKKNIDLYLKEEEETLCRPIIGDVLYQLFTYHRKNIYDVLNVVK